MTAHWPWQTHPRRCARTSPRSAGRTMYASSHRAPLDYTCRKLVAATGNGRHVHHVTPTSSRRALALRDLTDPAVGARRSTASSYPFRGGVVGPDRPAVARDCSSRIVTVAENYDRLRFDADAVTGDRRYSRYLDTERMLRLAPDRARIPALLTRHAIDRRARSSTACLACATAGTSSTGITSVHRIRSTCGGSHGRARAGRAGSGRDDRHCAAAVLLA